MPQPSITEVRTPQSRCRFACGWVDITPPVGIYHRMWGAAKHERATGVHRPLRATVAVFEAHQPTASPLETRQILLALDHCVLGAQEHDQLVTQVAKISGQPEETILVVFAHTHGAGLMGLDRANLPGGDLIPTYLESMGQRAGELVADCVKRLGPATIVYGQGRCDLAAHRDFFDGKKNQFVCGFNPGVAADDTVLVARVTDAKGGTMGTLVNYACHPTTLAWDNTLISPDYIGALREIVEEATGVPCLFLQGASGELGPREGFVGDPSVADRNGRQLGYAALAALTALPQPGTHFSYLGPVISGATLGAWSHEGLSSADWEQKAEWRLWRWREGLPYRPGQPTVEQAAAELKQFQMEEDKARAAGQKEQAAELRAMAERKRRLLHRLAQLPPGPVYPLQVVLWKMGDAFWVGVQGESYSVLQTELRRRFSRQPIVVASIAGDWGASYLPPADLYGKGIYQESIAVVAAGSVEQLIEAIARRIAV